MPSYKAIRCFHCDSVILSNMPNIAPHPSGNAHLCTLRCPVCSAITLQVNVSELKRNQYRGMSGSGDTPRRANGEK